MLTFANILGCALDVTHKVIVGTKENLFLKVKQWNIFYIFYEIETLSEKDRGVPSVYIAV